MKSLTQRAWLSLGVMIAASTANAAEAPPPSVSQPSGINLGVTSFFDGFAGPPGWTHLVYLRQSRATSIRNNQGKDVAVFDGAAIASSGNALGLRHPPHVGGRTEGFFRGLILGPLLEDGALRRRKWQLSVITFQYVLEDLGVDPTQERYFHS